MTDNMMKENKKSPPCLANAFLSSYYLSSTWLIYDITSMSSQCFSFIILSVIDLLIYDDNMMKEKHWLDMEVIYRHILTRSVTDNMMKENHWLDMEVIYRPPCLASAFLSSYYLSSTWLIYDVTSMSSQCFSFIILSVLDLVNIWPHLHV
jgi:hypothetical protein